jgi:3-dehydroquinate dehydratase-2
MLCAATMAHYNAARPPAGVPLARKAQTSKGRAQAIYVLNGPNLNLIGTREPEIYGRTTLAEIGKMSAARAKTHGYSVAFRQTNSEGELIDWLQEARHSAAGVVLNAAGLSHTSVAVLDAVRAVERPVIEVHLSNPYRREIYRRRSYISEAATGVICGLGAEGYLFAIDALAHLLGHKAA